MKVHLLATECWGIVAGDEVRPEPLEEADNNADDRRRRLRTIREYDLKEAKAMSEIHKSVAEELLYLVASGIGTVSAKGQWDTLVAHFEKDSMANQMQVLLRLVNSKQDEKSINEYYKDHMDLTSRLHAMTCDVSQKSADCSLHKWSQPQVRYHQSHVGSKR